MLVGFHKDPRFDSFLLLYQTYTVYYTIIVIIKLYNLSDLMELRIAETHRKRRLIKLCLISLNFCVVDFSTFLRRRCLTHESYP